jgi:hypothetical protein
LRLIAAVTNPAKKRLLLTKYFGPSSRKCGIPLSSELAKSTEVKREKRMKKTRWLEKSEPCNHEFIQSRFRRKKTIDAGYKWAARSG